MGGTVKQFYEDGIRASFKANGAAGVETYLQSTSTQVPYVDPKNPANNAPALTTTTVRWDESATNEQKLKNHNAEMDCFISGRNKKHHREFRRTGYPKLSVAVSKNPDLPLGTFIKRLTYPNVVTNASKAAVDGQPSLPRWKG